VADKDFTIPPFSLKYFDTTTKQIKTIQTKSIDVKVKGAKVKTSPLTIKRAQEIQTQEPSEVVKIKYENSKLLLFISFAIGMACGVVLMLLKSWKFKTKEKSINIKDEKVLLIKLLPYKDDKQVQQIVDILEHNIYSKDKQKIDKKVLKEVIKKYNLV